jgi:23S rRNA (cytosine1962-C5)-methyltransferase
MSKQTETLNEAWQGRQSALEGWHQEGTDCYRLLHGTVENWRGVTADRYGETLLIQSFHEALSEADITGIWAFYSDRLGELTRVVYNDRSAANSRRRQAEVEAEEADFCRLG